MHINPSTLAAVHCPSVYALKPPPSWAAVGTFNAQHHVGVNQKILN